MRLLRTDSRTGVTFKRGGSNFPHGSKQRARAYNVTDKLNVLKEVTNLGPINSLAVALMVKPI